MSKFIPTKRPFSAIFPLALTLIGVPVLALGCMIRESDAPNDDAAGGRANEVSGGSGGAGQAGTPEAGAGGAAAGTGGAESETGGAAGDGGAGGAIVEIPVPDEITDGDTRVSCTITCEAGEECAKASVFVSACATDTPGLCYEVTPIDDPSGDGNTYIVSLGEGGGADVIENARCTAANESTEGLRADLLFVIDTSSSMAGAIDGVVDSIDSFVDDLASKGVAMRIGGLAFANASPLPGCPAPEAPFVPFTDRFGPGTETDPESFNYWIGNVTSSHCGDDGDDIPENALDALGFALGRDPDPNDEFEANAFEWDPAALHVVVVITDAAQHERSSGTETAHFDLDEIAEDLRGFAVVHAVGPNYGCHDTPAFACACNETENSCDEGCDCDLRCPTAGCAEDETVDVCDDASCDPDCPGYRESSCDVLAGICDYASDSSNEACSTDVDCAGGAVPGTPARRRCEPQSQAPYVDIGELSRVTGGTFTTLSYDGSVDLTKLPLSGVLVSTEECAVTLPEDASAIRCVYVDEDGHSGEAVVELD